MVHIEPTPTKMMMMVVVVVVVMISRKIQDTDFFAKDNVYSLRWFLGILYFHCSFHLYNVHSFKLSKKQYFLHA